MSRFVQSLIAVVAGNAIYFLVVDPRLPPPYRHQLYRLDWGVVIDFWICLCLWGMLEMILRRYRARCKAR